MLFLAFACAAPLELDHEPMAPDAVPAEAVEAWRCAAKAGDTQSTVLAVADFSRPSDEKRLTVVDVDSGEVLLKTHVTHGSGSGGRRATLFTDAHGSHATSLGVYRASNEYSGKWGRSRRLDGLEPGFNGTARGRAIVVHRASYATPAFIEDNGRLGRSWGCFAVAPRVADRFIDLLDGGALLVAWADDEDWRERSVYQDCD